MTFEQIVESMAPKVTDPSKEAQQQLADRCEKALHGMTNEEIQEKGRAQYDQHIKFLVCLTELRNETLAEMIEIGGIDRQSIDTLEKLSNLIALLKKEWRLN